LAILLSGALPAIGLGVHFDVPTRHSEASLYTASAIIHLICLALHISESKLEK